MKIALFGTVFSEHFDKYIQHLIKKLEAEKIDIVIEDSFYTFLKGRLRFKFDVETFKDSVDLKDKKVDILFSIGGDGTLLKAITFIKKTNVPIMGINTGRLGFISSIPPDQIDIGITLFICSIFFKTMISLASKKSHLLLNNLFSYATK